ncbi:YciI family protein [Ekhidna sp.]|uniref:YciI family protein n=1 Tax=Ekhidna sp. TaxID=2608089 RepID=UPI003B5BFC43
MKNLFIISILFLGIIACEQNPKDETKSVDTVDANSALAGYDSLLAAETGADDYGMRRYVMALLKAGPNRDQDSTEAAELQRAHLDNITRMAEEGKLVLAGPFFDDWEVKGIYIFAVETIEEAEELTKTDPAIQAGRLVMELHPWYGSAGLMKIGEMHKRLAKESI